MVHTVQECRAKDPRSCPYHGVEANLTQAIQRGDIEAYLIAKEQLLPSGPIDSKVNQNSPSFVATIRESRLDWGTPEGNYSVVVQQKLKFVRGLMDAHGVSHWSLMAFRDDPDDPVTGGHISMSGHAMEYGQRPILAFNEAFVTVADEEALTQMAYHEIAHARLPLCNAHGIKHLHGREWQEEAKRLGFKFSPVIAGRFVSLDYRKH